MNNTQPPTFLDEREELATAIFIPKVIRMADGTTQEVNDPEVF